MFIREVKNSSGQIYHQIVESYRNEEGKARQRILLSLGRAEDGNAAKLLEALGRHQKSLDALNLAKDVSVDKTYILGPVLLLNTLIENIGLHEIIKDTQALHPKLEFDLFSVIYTIILSRLIEPCSKLKIFDHWQKIFFSSLVVKDIPLHHFYRALDILAERKEELEKSLYWVGRDLFNQRSDVVLYDLTTLRFESTWESEKLRRFGFSKEKRSDCTQVVLGLLLDTDGVPLGFEVYPGNTFEGNTIADIINKTRKKFRIRRLILVADRGLFSKKNLDFLREESGEFIVGCKLGSFPKEDQKDFYDSLQFEWVIEGDLAVQERKTQGGDRLIITWSRVRAERDAKTRDDILNKIRQKLGKKTSAKKFVSNSNYQKFIKGLDVGKPELNLEAIENARAKDGFFGIVTNVTTLTRREIILNYKELWKIEDAFGELKGTLQARPVFHWTDQRIIGHLTACFLSYYCESIATKCLREKNEKLKARSVNDKTISQRPLTVVEALIALNEVRAIPVRIKNKIIWVRTDITGNAATSLQAIGARIPPKVLKIEEEAPICSGTKHDT